MFVAEWQESATKTGGTLRDPNDPGTLDLICGRLLLGDARVSTED